MLNGRRLFLSPSLSPCSQGTLGTGQASVQAAEGRGRAVAGRAGQGRDKSGHKIQEWAPGLASGLVDLGWCWGIRLGGKVQQTVLGTEP